MANSLPELFPHGVAEEPSGVLHRLARALRLLALLERQRILFTVNLETLGVELLSGEERNIRYPNTFLIPGRAKRESLLPGQLAKLLFCYTGDPEEDIVERMWVIVESRNKHGEYVGILDNDPIRIPSLEAGMCLPFLAEHIIDADDVQPVDGISGKPRLWGKKLLSFVRKR